MFRIKNEKRIAKNLNNRHKKNAELWYTKHRFVICVVLDMWIVFTCALVLPSLLYSNIILVLATPTIIAVISMTIMATIEHLRRKQTPTKRQVPTYNLEPLSTIIFLNIVNVLALFYGAILFFTSKN